MEFQASGKHIEKYSLIESKKDIQTLCDVLQNSFHKIWEALLMEKT